MATEKTLRTSQRGTPDNASRTVGQGSHSESGTFLHKSTPSSPSTVPISQRKEVTQREVKQPAEVVKLDDKSKSHVRMTPVSQKPDKPQWQPLPKGGLAEMEMPEGERHTNRHLPLLVHKGPSQWFLWQPESANEIAVTAVLNFKPPSQTGRG